MRRAAGFFALTVLWATAAGADQVEVSSPRHSAETTPPAASALVDPSTVSGAIKAGIASLKASRHTEAREHFAVARSLSPQWPLAHLYWAIAETTVTTSDPPSLALAMRLATCRIIWMSASELPPYFCTTRATVLRLPPHPLDLRRCARRGGRLGPLAG